MVLRVITGVIGIIIAAVVIQLGGAPFACFAIFLSLVAWHEFSDAFGRAGIATTYIFGAFTLVLLLCCAWIGNIEELLAVLTIGTLAMFLMMVFLGMRPTDVCVSTAGVVYIGMPFAHLILLRFSADEKHPLESFINITNTVNEKAAAIGQPDLIQSLSTLNFDTGCELVWILFACTWASDTFAYFIGSAVGSHRLAPSISPNKTVEGFLGSILGTVLVAIFVGNLIFSFEFTQMAIAGLILSIAATLGDLVESAIKRYTNVKDSGFLIPGHGGVLDRFDSLFFTAPIFYYYVIVMQMF